jgi:hypothetical protein
MDVTNNDQYLLEKLWKARQPAALFGVLPVELVIRIFSLASPGFAASPPRSVKTQRLDGVYSGVFEERPPPMEADEEAARNRRINDPQPPVPHDAELTEKVSNQIRESPIPPERARKLWDDAMASRAADDASNVPGTTYYENFNITPVYDVGISVPMGYTFNMKKKK